MFYVFLVRCFINKNCAVCHFDPLFLYRKRKTFDLSKQRKRPENRFKSKHEWKSVAA